jgi:Cu(I)/Ag(I) efflux system membrane fusion protein
MPEHRTVSARHAAIPEWNWPAMTMEFTVDAAVDFDELREGADLHMEVTRTAGGEYAISAIHVIKPEEPGAAEESAVDGSDGGVRR